MKWIVLIAIIFCFYIVSAYGTTDILRLLPSSRELNLLSLSCYCSTCHHKLSFYDQIPIISYFVLNGKCRYCQNKIPSRDHYLEITLFVGFFFITLFFSANTLAYILDLLFYETAKIILILKFGLRKDNTFRELISSLIQNIFIFSVMAFLFFLYYC